MGTDRAFPRAASVIPRGTVQAGAVPSSCLATIGVRRPRGTWEAHQAGPGVSITFRKDLTTYV